MPQCIRKSESHAHRPLIGVVGVEGPRSDDPLEPNPRRLLDIDAADLLPVLLVRGARPTLLLVTLPRLA